MLSLYSKELNHILSDKTFKKVLLGVMLRYKPGPP